MEKRSKRIITRLTALVLALSMVLSCTVTVFATETEAVCTVSVVEQQDNGVSDSSDTTPDSTTQDPADTEDSSDPTPDSTTQDPADTEDSSAPAPDSSAKDPADTEDSSAPAPDSSAKDPADTDDSSDSEPDKSILPPLPEPKQRITGVEKEYKAVWGKKITLQPKAQGKLTYQSADKKVATVSSQGVISVVGVGTTTVTIKAAKTDIYAAATYTVTVVGQKKEQVLTISQPTYSILFKKNKTFSLTAKTSGDGKLTYQSSNPAVVSVNSKGVCTMKKLGEAQITITAAETAKYESATTVVKVAQYHRPKILNYSKSYKNSKYYKKLTALQLTGDTRHELVSIALSQLGYHEGKNSSQLGGNGKGEGNHTEYGRYYGLTYGAWCAMFVNWVAREAGVSKSDIPKYCAVRDYYSYYHRNGRKFYSWNTIRNKKYTPQEGDLIMYANVKGGVAHHIGFVISTEYKDGKVVLTTVEGNTKDQVRRVVMKMSPKSTGYVNEHWILGVAHPNV